MFTNINFQLNDDKATVSHLLYDHQNKSSAKYVNSHCIKLATNII